ncbi:MAG: isochorismate synthase [Magnetospirillum sp. WYHS-4]
MSVRAVRRHPPFLDQARQQALDILADREEGLVSLTLPAPAGLVPKVPAGLTDFRFLARPSEGLALLGHRQAAKLRARGPGRFGALADFLARAGEAWRHGDPAATGLRPRAFVGFSFAAGGGLTAIDLLPEAEIVVPAVLLQNHGGTTAFTFTARPGGRRSAEAIADSWIAGAAEVMDRLTRVPDRSPAGPLRRLDSEPEDAVWLARVGRALTDIRAGRLDKVVLTRRLRVVADRPFEPSVIMDRLAERHGACTLFALADDSVTAVGATPERLVALEGRQVRSDALAGTLPLGPSSRPDEKDRHEHRLVADAILSALRPVCEELDYPPHPRLLRLSSLQHLWTPVTGRARPGVSLLDLAARLHPTPAVGGSPYRVAMDWLAHEGERRIGWYTGGIGWVDAEGDGDIAVVLRCAALNGDTAILSAGAGIVAGSDPKAELAETELKLATMLDALGGAPDGR